MGNYLSQDELKTRFEDDVAVAALTDSTTVDTDVLDDVIEAAEGTIDSYLAKRYAVPVTLTDSNTSRTLKRLALDLAEIFLLRRGSLVSEAKDKQYADAIARLKDYATGLAVLPAAGPPVAATADSPVVDHAIDGALSTSSRIFSRSRMSGL